MDHGSTGQAEFLLLLNNQSNRYCYTHQIHISFSLLQAFAYNLNEALSLFFDICGCNDGVKSPTQ